MTTTQPFNLQQIAWDANNTALFSVVAWTLMAYDHLLTIQDEIDLVWKSSSWRFGKAVYIWNRYFSFATVTFSAYIRLFEVKSDATCAIYLQIFGVTGSLMLCTVDFILMLRVWVLFDCSRTFLYIFVPLMLVEVTALIYMGAKTVVLISPFIHTGPAVPGCLSLTKPEIWAFYPVPLLVITCSMFLMTTFKAGRTLFMCRRSGAKMPLISLFFRDGIFWFLAVFTVAFPHMMICWVARPTLNEVMIGPCLAAYSIIAARTLLNIKTILTRQSSDVSMISTVLPLDTMQFGAQSAIRSYRP